MRSPLKSSTLCALLALCVTGCASNPKPVQVQPPSLPAEMMKAPPPPGYFLSELERILSGSWNKPKP